MYGIAFHGLKMQTLGLKTLDFNPTSKMLGYPKPLSTRDFLEAGNGRSFSCGLLQVPHMRIHHFEKAMQNRALLSLLFRILHPIVIVLIRSNSKKEEEEER